MRGLNDLNRDDSKQTNSFPCVVCGEVYTEESGAEEGFTCEQCNLRKLRLASIKKLIYTLKNSELYEIQDFLTHEIYLSNVCIANGSEKEE